jgi:manganese transport protein
VKAVFSIALGVIAAIGGFVDIGDLVFNAQAGSSVGTPALWATPVGVVGIMVFAEMSGRIVAVSKKPNFVLVKER